MAVVWRKVFAVLPGDFCKVPKPPIFDSAIFFWCLSLCIKTSRDPSQMASVQWFKTVVLTQVQLFSGRRCLLCWLVMFCRVAAKPPLFDSAISFWWLSLCIKTSRDPLQMASVQTFKTVVLTWVQLLSGGRCFLHWLVIFCQVPKPPLFDSAISFQCLSLCIKTSRDPFQTASVQRFKTVVLSYLSAAVVWWKVFSLLAGDFLPSSKALFDSANIQALLPLLLLSQLPSIDFSCGHPPLLWLQVKHEVLTQLQLLSGRRCLLCWLVLLFCQVPKPQLFDSAISIWCLSLCIKTSRDPLQTASTKV